MVEDIITKKSEAVIANIKMREVAIANINTINSNTTEGSNIMKEDMHLLGAQIGRQASSRVALTNSSKMNSAATLTLKNAKLLKKTKYQRLTVPRKKLQKRKKVMKNRSMWLTKLQVSLTALATQQKQGAEIEWKITGKKTLIHLEPVRVISNMRNIVVDAVATDIEEAVEEEAEVEE